MKWLYTLTAGVLVSVFIFAIFAICYWMGFNMLLDGVGFHILGPILIG